MQRWTLYDPVADETLTFTMNPNESSTPMRPWQTESWGASPTQFSHREWRAPQRPFEYTVSGVTYDGAFHAAMMTSWAFKPQTMVLTDHLDYALSVKLVDYAFDRKGSRGGPNRNRVRYTYTLKFLVYSDAFVSTP